MVSGVLSRLRGMCGGITTVRALPLSSPRRGVDGPPNTRRPASNLTRAVNQFLANGFTAQQVSDILHYAADNVCPQYHDVIVQTVSSW